MPSGKYGIGIDLGTAKTCTSVFRNDKAEIIPHEGNPFMPSCVAFSETGRLIGSAAKRQAILNSKNTITSVLRFVGRKFHDPSLQTLIKTVPFRVIEESSRPAFVVEHQNQDLVLTPVEVIAMILGRARRDAEEFLGGQYMILGAVISVPVYFNMDQRQAIRDAAAIAKLNLLRLISASVLACLNYATSAKAEKARSVLVIDIGAAFLNVALVEIEEGVVEVKAVAGDTFLGGEDFDSRLIDYLASNSRWVERLPIDSGPQALSGCRHACETAKRKLSTVDETQIELCRVYKGGGLIFPITRSQLERQCADLFRSSTVPIEQVLRESRLEKSNVEEVVIVGGSSRIPKLKSIWSEFFNHLSLIQSLDPDEAVARGAGFQAAVLTGDQSSNSIKEIMLIDILPFAIGIETARGIVTPIMKRNTPIPTKKASLFSTSEDNQENFPISIYEGEQTRTEDNKLMGQFSFTFSPAPRGIPRIEVTVDVNSDMRITVYAVEKLSGKNAEFTLISGDTISKREIRQMSQSAEIFDEADGIGDLRFQAKNNMEEYICTTLSSYSSQRLTDQTPEVIRLAEINLRWLEDNPRAQETEYATRLVQFMQIVLDLDDKEKHQRARNDNLAINRKSINEPPPSSAVVSQAGRGSSVQLLEINEQQLSVSEGQLNEDHTTDELSSDSKIPSENTPVNPPSQGDGNFQSSNASVALPIISMVHTDSPRYFKGANTAVEDATTGSQISERVTQADGQRFAVEFEGPISRQESPPSLEVLASPEVTRPDNPAQSDPSFAELFSPSESSMLTYTDQDFLRISTYLRNVGQATWSNIPRIYTVLRLINQLDLIDLFVDQGITDIWLPFSPASLPNALSPTIRACFVEKQSVVLSKSLLFEKSSDRPHVHFPQGEVLPFQVVAKLGAGAHATVDKVMSIVSHREYARKLFRRQKGVSKDDVKSFLTELQVLKRVHHYHCIELVC